jgi:hypothetical protein
MLIEKDKTRFLKKFKQESENECWLWIGSKDYYGYGTFWLNGKPEQSHRISYQLSKGEIPKGIKVLHKCDNPSCVNPNHLFLGTQKDNMSDCKNKGRISKAPRNCGEKNWNFGKKHSGNDGPASKLTWKKVREIRSSDLSSEELAKKFGVHIQTISDVRRFKTWKKS